MNKKWKIDILGNYCTLENGLKIKNEKLPYLDVKYLREQSNTKFKMNGNKVFKNDLLILVDGENSGELFQASEDGYMGSTFKKVIVKDINHNFLKNIIIQNKEFYKKTKTGSAIPHLNKHLFKNTKFLCPPLEEQEKIANLLSSLDNKIELNNQINKDLEEIAQTLYTKWFVNFDFPNEEGKPYKSSGGKMIDSELGEIPVGWKIGKMIDYFEFIKGIEVGSANYLNKNFENTIRFIRVGDMESLDGSTYIENTLIKSILCNSDDVLISMDGSIGRVVNGLNGCYSSGIRNVIAKDDLFNSKGFIYLLLKSERVQYTINQFVHGSVIKHAGKSINHLKFIVPTEEYMIEFKRVIEPIYNQIIKNKLENQELKEIRDLLLPYLMTGKISVDNV